MLVLRLILIPLDKANISKLSTMVSTNLEVRWCSNCLTMSTRPRITFDDRGFCNACRWQEQKKLIDWEKREQELAALLNKHRSTNGDYDCLVPVSGGKDGSYVAYNLQEKYGMHPLCVTVTPALPTGLGEQNLRSFVESGFSHISVNPNSSAMKKLNKAGFTKVGFPYYGWLIAIMSAPMQVALNFGIQLIFYGEDGEVEYGGSNETQHEPIYDMSYQRRVYLEGGYEKVLSEFDLTDSSMNFFKFPNEDKFSEGQLKLTHWSYFENWDPYRNYLVAKEHCGLMEASESNSGTFTNFAQNDQDLYALHTYLMYLKFGFGRANQDACIEVRRGAMDRSQALNLVRMYDGIYPSELIDLYLDYYQMTNNEFDDVLDRFANKNLFEKVNGRWTPKFNIV